MSLSRKLTTTALSFLLLAPLPVLAQDAAAPAADAPAAEAEAARPEPLAPGLAGGHGAAPFIASNDLNGDGKVTMDELLTVRKYRLLGADKDGDGAYSEEEYVAEFEGRLRLDYAAQNREIDEFFEMNLKQAANRFALLDRDRDGFLSLEEDLASAVSHFEALDTNGDGVVSAEDPPRERRQRGENEPETPETVGTRVAPGGN